MKASWILVCLAAAAVASACDGKTSGKGGCEANTDCDSGEICDQGTCYEVCNTDLQCGSGKICTSSRCVDGERSNTPSILSIDGDSAAVCPEANDTHCLAAGLVIDGEHLEGAELFLSDGTHNWDLAIRDGATASHVEVDLPDVAPGDYTLTAANSVGSVDQTLTLLQGEPGEAYSPTPDELVDDINSATNTIAFARLPTGTGGDEVAIGNHVHSGADITSGTIDIAQLPSSLFAGEVSSLADLFQTGFAANPPPVGTGNISAFQEWIPVGTSTRFLKTTDASLLVVTYSGNLRIGAGDTGSSYSYLEIRMDNGQMTPRCYQRTHNRVDSASQKNYHVPYQTVCVGENIPKGVHEVSLWLYNDGNSSGGDAYLNWRSPQGLLLVEEIHDTSRLAYTRAGATSGEISSTSDIKMDGREITYDKQDASSIMRVTYADTYRVSYPSNAGSGWVTVYVDDATFPGTPCHFRKYDNVVGTSAQDHHNPFVLQCIFEGLAAGPHKFDVYTRDVGAGTSYLGWGRSYPLLVVEELNADDPTRSYSNGANTVGNVTGNGIATGRQVIHTVTQDNATLKISFSDTFRTSYGCNAGSGSVEILMDSASLPVPCEMGMYHDNGFGASAVQDHHWPAHLVCIARGIDAGQHIFNVEWTTYDCGSLYLGWERGQNLLVIEEL